MLKSAKSKFSFCIGSPTGKSSCCLLYIFLCVVTAAHRKQFHYLPGKIFIGVVFPVLIIIQKIQHRTRFRHLMKKITKVSQRILTNNIQQILLKKNIQISTGKMTMPEKRHFFPQLRSLFTISFTQ